MANVTLIGERLAEVGTEFTYLGPCSDCKDCKVKSVCFNLEKGKRYRVVGIRDTRHECKVHDSGVIAVDYEELPKECALEQKQVMEGMVVTVTNRGCENRHCSYYELCSEETLASPSKVKILQKKEQIECLEGKKLFRVEVEEVEK